MKVVPEEKILRLAQICEVRFQNPPTKMPQKVFLPEQVAFLLKKIVDVHAIEAEPVRSAEWAHLGGDEWCCTNCGEVIHTEGSWEKPDKKYCEECGAKMDKGEDHDD